MPRALAFAALLLASTAPALAQNSAPQPVPFADTIPGPQDVDYPGTLKLDVDATNTQQGIFAVKETVPVAQAGHMVLLFPKWLPGTHGPRGEIEKLAGLHIRANGKDVPWKRDPVDVFAFHVDVPEGARQLDLAFQFISATVGDQGRIVMTPALMSLQWNSMSLYPAGYFTRRIPIVATVRYPEGWSAASAVPATKAGSTYTYDKTNYEVLVDSPVLAGRWYKPIELTPRVTVDAFADTSAELAAKPDQIAALKNMVDQEVKLMGAQH
jgi:predicted metalloprotease with PDZ domain